MLMEEREPFRKDELVLRRGGQKIEAEHTKKEVGVHFW